MPKIRLNNFSLKYYQKKADDIVAVDNITATFDSEKITVIVGESGCGKTSILKAIAGLLDYEGEIYVDDIEFSTVPFSDRNLSYVDQNIFLFPHFTIYDNIRFPLKERNFTRQEIDIRVKTLAEAFGISQCLSRQPKHLSIGQAQRAAIAKALIKKPNIILFDEATSNLDPLIAQDIISHIKQYVIENKTTCIFVTHSIKEALQIGDKIIVMNEGKIIEEGTPEKLLDSKVPETRILFESGLLK